MEVLLDSSRCPFYLAVAGYGANTGRALLAPTFSDTLMAYTSGKAKIFGISGKDRSAVAMAGQLGTALVEVVDRAE